MDIRPARNGAAFDDLRAAGGNIRVCDMAGPARFIVPAGLAFHDLHTAGGNDRISGFGAGMHDHQAAGRLLVVAVKNAVKYRGGSPGCVPCLPAALELDDAVGNTDPVLIFMIQNQRSALIQEQCGAPVANVYRAGVAIFLVQNVKCNADDAAAVEIRDIGSAAADDLRAAAVEIRDKRSAAADNLHAAVVDSGARHHTAGQYLRRAAVLDSSIYGSAAVPKLKDMTGNGQTGACSSAREPVDAARLEGCTRDFPAASIFLYYATALDNGIQRRAAARDDLSSAAHKGGHCTRAAIFDGLGAAVHGADRTRAAIFDGLRAAVYGLDRARATTDILCATVYGRDRTRAATADVLTAAVHSRDRACAADPYSLTAVVHSCDRTRAADFYVLIATDHSDDRATAADVLIAAAHG